MIRVLNIISDTNIGGAGRVLLNYLRYAHRDQFDLAVAIPRGSLLKAPLEELGADAQGAVYVGDSEVDIETARNAGLPCLSVSWGFRDTNFLLQQGAQRILSSPADLLALLTGAAN